jgi:hypothetical protein
VVYYFIRSRLVCSLVLYAVMVSWRTSKIPLSYLWRVPVPCAFRFLQVGFEMLLLGAEGLAINEDPNFRIVITISRDAHRMFPGDIL